MPQCIVWQRAKIACRFAPNRTVPTAIGWLRDSMGLSRSRVMRRSARNIRLLAVFVVAGSRRRPLPWALEPPLDYRQPIAAPKRAPRRQRSRTSRTRRGRPPARRAREVSATT
jgi:hypothetical protein